MLKDLDILYMDYAASTPMRAEAVDAMLPFLRESFANPSGSHAAARSAKTALEEAREQVASALGADPSEVIFTGGGTESDNLAVEGAARAARAAGVGDGVVVGAFEHKAVLAAADRLGAEGFRVSRIGATSAGVIDLDSLARALDANTVLVSVMMVNNEIGTIQPLDQVERIIAEHAPKARLHTDAVQAVPWIDVAGAGAGADLISISAHKFGGPKGVGALIARRGVALEPLIEGGGQERGWRAGTVNVAGVVAMATALTITVNNRAAEVAAVGALRNSLLAGLSSRIEGLVENGDREIKVAGNAHVAIANLEAEVLLMALDRVGVCAAAGSSCSSGATEPSHVLAAMGMSESAARSSIRLSLGFASTKADVDGALERIPAVVAQLRTQVGAA